MEQKETQAKQADIHAKIEEAIRTRLRVMHDVHKQARNERETLEWLLRDVLKVSVF